MQGRDVYHLFYCITTEKRYQKKHLSPHLPQRTNRVSHTSQGPAATKTQRALLKFGNKNCKMAPNFGLDVSVTLSVAAPPSSSTPPPPTPAPPSRARTYCAMLQLFLHPNPSLMIALSRLLLNVLLASLLLSAVIRPAAAKARREGTEFSLWSCAHDMVTYCNDIAPGDMRMQDCLVYHRRLLLPVCRDKKSTYREPVPAACEGDAQKHCLDENAQDKTRCLRVKFARLSQGCLDALPLNPPFESLPIELKYSSVEGECAAALLRECRHTVGGKDLVDCAANRISVIAQPCGLVAPAVDAYVYHACRADADRFCRHP